VLRLLSIPIPSIEELGDMPSIGLEEPITDAECMWSRFTEVLREADILLLNLFLELVKVFLEILSCCIF
jgi:hypothetical protein